jgi:hypothetical protein
MRSSIRIFGTMDGRVDLVLDGGACSGAGATTPIGSRQALHMAHHGVTPEKCEEAYRKRRPPERRRLCLGETNK